MTSETGTTPTAADRTTVVVTQRERFGMTAESLESLIEHTPGLRLIYVDGNSPERWKSYLEEMAAEHGFSLIRKEHFLTPNQARNIGLAAAETEFVAFCDNDVLFTDGWLDRLVACAEETDADVVAPLTCQGLPAHTEIHHAGGDYAKGGDMEGFFVDDQDLGRDFVEVMHGHGVKLDDLEAPLERQETGMCEFHCALARRTVFDRIGPLDEGMWSTKEHIDFCMAVRRAGGRVMFEPSSVITYVFPCRARPMSSGGLALLLASLVERLWPQEPGTLHPEMAAQDGSGLRRQQEDDLHHAALAGAADPVDAADAAHRAQRPDREESGPGAHVSRTPRERIHGRPAGPGDTAARPRGGLTPDGGWRVGRPPHPPQADFSGA